MVVSGQGRGGGEEREMGGRDGREEAVEDGSPRGGPKAAAPEPRKAATRGWFAADGPAQQRASNVSETASCQQTGD